MRIATPRVLHLLVSPSLPQYGARATSWRVLASHFSVSSPHHEKNNYKLLVVGGGTGGCTIAAKMLKKFGPGEIGIIEPSDKHYYQPLFTLVGAGVTNLDQCAKPMSKVLPSGCDWIHDSAAKFDPENSTVTTIKGNQIKYDYLVVAMGMQLNFDQIKGLPEALVTDARVCSNYSPKFVTKTYAALQNFNGGNAIFTFPATPIKCPGAPQKIMYLADAYFRKHGKRDTATLMYNSSLGVIFGVKKYADSLWKVVESRNLKVNLKRNLIEVKPETSEAIFKLLDSEKGETETYKYDMLHVTPPMSTPDSLRTSKLVNETGFVPVDKGTLQHTVYPNVFSLGDCSNLPTSRTAAAIASQSKVLQQNLTAIVDGHKPAGKYDGYTSCPLITSYNKCILAEFDYDLTPMETFPVDQGKERYSMYYMKKDVMPIIYWQMFLKGMWSGPAVFRKLFSKLKFRSASSPK